MAAEVNLGSRISQKLSPQNRPRALHGSIWPDFGAELEASSVDVGLEHAAKRTCPSLSFTGSPRQNLILTFFSEWKVSLSTFCCLALRDTGNVKLSFLPSSMHIFLFIC
jgi:hypothetical protein